MSVFICLCLCQYFSCYQSIPSVISFLLPLTSISSTFPDTKLFITSFVNLTHHQLWSLFSSQLLQSVNIFVNFSKANVLFQADIFLSPQQMPLVAWRLASLSLHCSQSSLLRPYLGLCQAQWMSWNTWQPTVFQGFCSSTLGRIHRAAHKEKRNTIKISISITLAVSSVLAVHLGDRYT